MSSPINLPALYGGWRSIIESPDICQAGVLLVYQANKRSGVYNRC